MKTRSSVVLPVISAVIAVFLGVASVIADVVSTTVFMSAVIFCAVGLLILVVSFFVKEKWLYNSALPMYIIFWFINMYVISFAEKRDYFSYRYVSFGPVTVSTLLFLSLTVCLIAKLISKYKSFNLYWMMFILSAVSLIFFILLYETQLHAIIICIIAGTIVYITMCRDDKISGPAVNKFFVPLLGVICVLLFAVTMKDYQIYRLAEQLKVMFTRGESSLETYGWARTQFDEVIATAKFFGENGFAENLQTNSLFHESNIFIFLIKYGWAVTLVVTAAVIMIMVLIWKMTFSVKNSGFMRYIALISASVLTSQLIYALLGVFAFPAVYIDIPFSGCSNSINFLDFILLGFITVCYVNRHKESSIKEDEIYDKNLIKSLVGRFFISEENIGINE